MDEVNIFALIGKLAVDIRSVSAAFHNYGLIIRIAVNTVVNEPAMGLTCDPRFILSSLE